MHLNFKAGYEQNAQEIQEKSLRGYYDKCTLHSPKDAFMLLLKNVEGKEPLNLDNLCENLQMKTGLSQDECYNLTQGDFSSLNQSQDLAKEIVFSSAIDCIKSGKKLGNGKSANGKSNTSSFLSHSIYEAIFASQLAKIIGVDSDKAMTYALLHDYGRKYTHKFDHVVEGFQALVDEGWIDESVSALTHSFLNGKRYANCDMPDEGFIIDENGNPSFEPKDDVAFFLNNYHYSIFDHIINIGDLMATSKGIVSPVERVADIRTRKPAGSNEGLFLSEFINVLNDMLKRMGIDNSVENVSACQSIDELRDKFQNISDLFYASYKEKLKGFEK